MVLYNIKGYSDYKITEDGVVYSLMGFNVPEAYSGGYILYSNNYGVRLSLKKLMALADLPYDECSHKATQEELTNNKNSSRRRDLEDRLRTKRNSFAW